MIFYSGASFSINMFTTPSIYVWRCCRIGAPSKVKLISVYLINNIPTIPFNWINWNSTSERKTKRSIFLIWRIPLRIPLFFISLKILPYCFLGWIASRILKVGWMVPLILCSVCIGHGILDTFKLKFLACCGLLFSLFLLNIMWGDIATPTSPITRKW